MSTTSRMVDPHFLITRTASEEGNVLQIPFCFSRRTLPDFHEVVCASAIRFVVAIVAGLALSTQAIPQTDPLPSWNDGAAKKAISEFVRATTDKTSARFVPPE